jgi:hypothetical protein
MSEKAVLTCAAGELTVVKNLLNCNGHVNANAAGGVVTLDGDRWIDQITVEESQLTFSVPRVTFFNRPFVVRQSAVEFAIHESTYMNGNDGPAIECNGSSISFASPAPKWQGAAFKGGAGFPVIAAPRDTRCKRVTFQELYAGYRFTAGRGASAAIGGLGGDSGFDEVVFAAGEFELQGSVQNVSSLFLGTPEVEGEIQIKSETAASCFAGGEHFVWCPDGGVL